MQFADVACALKTQTTIIYIVQGQFFYAGISLRARWWRGLKRFFIKANVLFCVPKENQKSTSDFDALDPRERGCSPLSDPEGVVETEKSWPLR